MWATDRQADRQTRRQICRQTRRQICTRAGKVNGRDFRGSPHESARPSPGWPLVQAPQQGPPVGGHVVKTRTHTHKHARRPVFNYANCRAHCKRARPTTNASLISSADKIACSSFLSTTSRHEARKYLASLAKMVRESSSEGAFRSFTGQTCKCTASVRPANRAAGHIIMLLLPPTRPPARPVRPVRPSLVPGGGAKIPIKATELA